ncbi:signal peptidase I [Balneola sp. MJW-20]|uniref:signal peptidase I n=1 Tax=Gracilimonas aurantiaca TaxID=3234185 RepID=UPI003467D8EA
MISVIFFGILCSAFILLKVYKVQTRSMVPAILPGDYILVSRYQVSPVRGDIIAFYRKREDGSRVMIKRVFAAAGDTMHITNSTMNSGNLSIPHDPAFIWLRGRVGSKEDTVLNYKYFLLESISASNLNRSPATGRDTRDSSIIVPGNHIFVVGDNYTESMDSRFWGFVHQDQIIGEVIASI